VFVCVDKQPIGYAVTGTIGCEGVTVKPYYNKKGRPHSGLCAEQFSELVHSWAREWRNTRHRDLRSSRHAVKVLVIDNHSSHTSPLTRRAALDEGIWVEILPRHSPDLSPHDSSMSGCARSRWREQCQVRVMSWVEQWRVFCRILTDMDTDAHINVWVSALHKYIAVEGVTSLDCCKVHVDNHFAHVQA
jgi:hypothetical protein